MRLSDIDNSQENSHFLDLDPVERIDSLSRLIRR